MGKDHETRCEVDTAIGMRRYHYFLEEDFHALATSTDIGDIYHAKLAVELGQVDAVVGFFLIGHLFRLDRDDTLWWAFVASGLDLAVGEDAFDGMVAASIDAHFEDA